jgi:hypothetical protein
LKSRDRKKSRLRKLRWRKDKQEVMRRRKLGQDAEEAKAERWRLRYLLSGDCSRKNLLLQDHPGETSILGSRDLARESILSLSTEVVEAIAITAGAISHGHSKLLREFLVKNRPGIFEILARPTLHNPLCTGNNQKQAPTTQGAKRFLPQNQRLSSLDPSLIRDDLHPSSTTQAA